MSPHMEGYILGFKEGVDLILKKLRELKDKENES